MTKSLNEDHRNAVVYLNILAYAVPVAVLVGTGTKSPLAALLTLLGTGFLLSHIMRWCRYEAEALRGLAWGGGLLTILASFLTLEKNTGFFILFMVTFAGFIYAVILTGARDDEDIHDAFDDDDEHPKGDEEEEYERHRRNYILGLYDRNRE